MAKAKTSSASLKNRRGKQPDMAAKAAALEPDRPTPIDTRAGGSYAGDDLFAAQMEALCEEQGGSLERT